MNTLKEFLDSHRSKDGVKGITIRYIQKYKYDFFPPLKNKIQFRTVH